MSILNHPAISKAYFFPQAIRCNEAIEVDIGEATLRCLNYRPNPELPTLVHFHGNGESVAHYVRGGFPPLFSEELCGINVLMIEYRGYGGSTGEVELVSMLADGQSVLQQLGIDPAKSIACGRSVGSLYAIELAHRCPSLAGLVIDSGIADIRERFLAYPQIRQTLEKFENTEVESDIRKHFDHPEKMRSYKGPLLLLHTQNDGIIDSSHAERLYDWAGTTNKELRIYADGNHNTIFPQNYRDMLFSIRLLCQAAFPNARWKHFNGRSNSRAAPSGVRVRQTSASGR